MGHLAIAPHALLIYQRKSRRNQAVAEGAPHKSGNKPILEVNELKVHFPFSRGSLWNRERGVVRAVDGVSLESYRGETCGLIDE